MRVACTSRVSFGVAQPSGSSLSNPGSGGTPTKSLSCGVFMLGLGDQVDRTHSCSSVLVVATV